MKTIMIEPSQMYYGELILVNSVESCIGFLNGNEGVAVNEVA